jgi:uncharacterized repeat protein (TIGR04138 family)
MLDPSHPLAKLLAEDKRYSYEAYVFVFEALNYAHTKLGMGVAQPGETSEEETGQKEAEESGEAPSEEEQAEQHLTGQQLCEAIRRYAQEQYGYMAKCVLNSWGVNSTSDFGEIVFNLIRIGQMRKTKEDRREDFDDVFDFETDLTQSFKITLSD